MIPTSPALRFLQAVLGIGVALNAHTCLTSRQLGQSTPDRLVRRRAGLLGVALNPAALRLHGHARARVSPAEV